MADDNDFQQTLVHKVRDSDLVFLVNIVNKTHASIGVSLLIKGTFVTGQLISGKTYYESVAEELKTAGDAGVSLSAYFSNKADSIYSPEEGKDAPNGFLHLKEVSVRNSGGDLGAINGACVRIKIEEIDGHFLGSMS